MLTQTLYDQDFAQWIEQTIQQLEQGNFNNLDVNNLIELSFKSRQVLDFKSLS
jgi:hypothetical protein